MGADDRTPSLRCRASLRRFVRACAAEYFLSSSRRAASVARAAAAAASALLARVPLALDVTYARGPNFPLREHLLHRGDERVHAHGALAQTRGGANVRGHLLQREKALRRRLRGGGGGGGGGVPSPDANDGSPQRLAAL